jgi:hypothetical protein
MSSPASHELWSIGGSRLPPGGQRSHPDIVPYSYSPSFVPVSVGLPCFGRRADMSNQEFASHLPGSSEVRSSAFSNSSLTSSLTGAMGNTSLPSQSSQSRSSLSRDDTSYPANDWSANQQIHSQQSSLSSQNPSYPLASLGNTAFMSSDLVANSLPLPDYNSANRTPYHSETDASASTIQELEREVVYLRRKVHELEIRAVTSPPPPPPQSPSFQASWKARTEARKRKFCSLNRAGNALCAWHDSRRERRAYPPRHAPPGYLNCGCTHDEALFEESLSRHHVGSYLPGETVRMDPALRNPLLKLLQQRYGYQDGDFERNPITGNWVENEGPAYWTAQAHPGTASRRRDQTHAERH